MKANAVYQKEIFLFFLAIFFILTATSLQAEEQSIQVIPTGPELIETEPRQVLTTSFRVTNAATEKREFIGSVKLPEGWQLITQEFPFELSPDESDVMLVSFFIPQGVLAGSYEIRYTVKDQKVPFISDWCSITVEVLPVTGLELKLLEAPEYVIAGEEYQSRFILVNQNNVVTTFSLEIKSQNDYPATVDLTKFQLKPGESRTIIVTVQTDVRIKKKIMHHLQLTVRTLDLKGEQLCQTATSSVEIIPRISGVEDPFHRLPVRIRLRGEMEDGEEKEYGFQSQISVLGTLDEEKTKHVDFLFKTSAIQDKTIFSEQNKYCLSYRGMKYGIYLGDRYYSLSPLTESSHYGRGIEGKLNLNYLTIKAYYEENPWIEPRQEATAIHLSYLLRENYKLNINYLKKRKEFTDEKILSLQGIFKPSKNIDLDLEFGKGLNLNGSGKNDKAYRLKVIGHYNWISYRLGIIHAGSDYPGNYSDMDSMSGGIALLLWKDIRLNTSYYEEKKNLGPNLDLYPIPQEKLYQLGLNYRFKTNTNLSFYYRNYKREDLLSEPTFNYQEETYKIGFGHNFEKLSISTSFEGGKKQDRLTDQSYELTKYDIFAFFRPSEKQSYSGYLQFFNDGSATKEHQHKITGGVKASFQLQERTFIYLNFQRSEHQEFSSENRDNFEIRLSHLLVNNNKFSICGQHTSYRNSDRKDKTTFMLDYAIPFGLAVSRKKSIGIVKGHLYDAESGKGIADVIIRVDGATAVTDREGNFIFPFLKPGEHYLRVDKAKIGLNKITIQKIPLKVNVEGGKETQVEIGVTRSARLSGQIMVYRFLSERIFIEEGERDTNVERAQDGNGEKFVKSHGLANTLVELTNGLEIKRRITDRKGNFRFEELRPGKWTLKVYSNNLPQYHYLEEDTFEFDLKPGDDKEILIKVLPKRRLIRIIEEGEILLEEEK